MTRLSNFIVKKRLFFVILFSILTIVSIVCSFFVNVNYNSADYLPKDSETKNAIEIMNENFGDNGTASVMIKSVSFSKALEVKKQIETLKGVTSVIWLDDIINQSKPEELSILEFWDLFQIISSENSTLQNVDFNDLTQIVKTMNQIKPNSLTNEEYWTLVLNLVSSIENSTDYEKTIPMFNTMIEAKPSQLTSNEYWSILINLFRKFENTDNVSELINIYNYLISQKFSSITDVEYWEMLLSLFENLPVNLDLTNMNSLLRDIRNAKPSDISEIKYWAYILDKVNVGDIDLASYNLTIIEKTRILNAISKFSSSMNEDFINILNTLFEYKNVKIDSVDYFISLINIFDYVLSLNSSIDFQVITTELNSILSLKPENLNNGEYIAILTTIFDKILATDTMENIDILSSELNTFLSIKPSILTDGQYFEVLTTIFKNVLNTNAIDKIDMMTEGLDSVLTYKPERLSSGQYIGILVGLLEKFPDNINPSDLLSSQIKSFYNNNSALFQITFDGTDYSEETMESIKQIKAIDETTYLSGNAATTYNSINILNKETTIAMIVAIIIIIIILFLTSSSYIEPLIFLIVIGIAALINMGTNVFMPSISYMSKGVSTLLQVALTIDYAIFLLHRYQEERLNTSDAKEAMKNALRNSFASILASALTTIAGFIAIMFMKYRIGFDMGFVFVKGITISLLAVFLLLPALIIYFDKLITKTKHPTIKLGFGKFGNFLKKYRFIIIAFFILLLAPAYIFQNKNSFVYGNEASLSSEGSTLAKEKDVIVDNFGIQNQMVILIPHEDSAYELDICRDLLKLNTDMNQDVILSVQSKSLIVSSGMTDFIPNSFMKNFVGNNYNRIIVSLNLPEESNLTTETISKTRDILKYYEIDYHLLGNSPSTLEIKSNVEKDYNIIMIISLVLIALIIMFTFKSYLIPVILVVVIQSSIWINMAIPAILNNKLIFIGYLIVSSVQLGATIDYAILLTSRYMEARKKYGKYNAMVSAIKSSYISIFTSGGILTISGIVVGKVSSVPAISAFGTMIGRGALCSMVLVFFLLPVILTILDKLIIFSTLKKNKALYVPANEQQVLINKVATSTNENTDISNDNSDDNDEITLD